MGLFVGRGVCNGALGTTLGRAGTEINSSVVVSLSQTAKKPELTTTSVASVENIFLNGIQSDWAYYGRTTYDVNLHTPFPVAHHNGKHVFGTIHTMQVGTTSSSYETRVTRFVDGVASTSVALTSVDELRRTVHRVSPSTLIMIVQDAIKVSTSPPMRAFRSADNGATWAECSALAPFFAARIVTHTVTALSGPPPGLLSPPLQPNTFPFENAQFALVAPKTKSTCIVALEAATPSTNTSWAWSVPEFTPMITYVRKDHAPPVPAQFIEYNFVEDSATVIGELTESVVLPYLQDLAGYSFFNPPAFETITGGAVAATHFSLAESASGPSITASAVSIKPSLRTMFATSDLINQIHYPGQIKIRAIFRPGAPTLYMLFNEGSGYEQYSLPPFSRGFGANLFVREPHAARQAIWTTTDFVTFTRLPDMAQPMWRLGKRRWHEDGAMYMPMYVGGKYSVFKSRDNVTWAKVQDLATETLLQPVLSEAESSIMPKYRTFEEVLRKDGRPAKLNPYSGAWVCDDRRPAPTL